MSTESFLSEKLQKFSILDIALVKWVYFLVGVLTCSVYTALMGISWIFYLLLALIAQMPIMIHFLSVKGSYFEKARNYLATNNPSNQVLLFLTTFLFACMVCTIFPVVASAPFYIYVILIVVLAVKPMRSNMFW